MTSGSSAGVKNGGNKKAKRKARFMGKILISDNPTKSTPKWPAESRRRAPRNDRRRPASFGSKRIRRGGANPDGGIDLVIERDGQRSAVQCKQWKTWNVGVRRSSWRRSTASRSSTKGGWLGC